MYTIAFAPILAADNSIIVQTGKHRNYYHIKYNLTADNIAAIPSALDTGSKKSKIKFKDGGQFEIVIKKSKFPVQAPNCDSFIKLRMPWTNPNSENSAVFIKEKRSIYNKIQALIDKGGEPIEVIIELNPYVELVSKTPLEVKLTKCNIFFRHARGRYIDYTGSFMPYAPKR